MCKSLHRGRDLNCTPLSRYLFIQITYYPNSKPDAPFLDSAIKQSTTSFKTLHPSLLNLHLQQDKRHFLPRLCVFHTSSAIFSFAFPLFLTKRSTRSHCLRPFYTHCIDRPIDANPFSRSFLVLHFGRPSTINYYPEFNHPTPAA